MGSVLEISDDARVRTLTLSRPERRNALDGGLLVRLAAALRDAEDDDAVGAVVLTGAPPAFCSGLDTTELAAGSFDWEALTDPAQSPWAVLATMRTFIVGAINGPAITGGLELALHCDLLIAAQTAYFADTHALLGLHPAGGVTVVLPRLVGRSRALHISLTGRRVSAQEALAIGLVAELQPTHAVVPRAQEIAAGVASSGAAGLVIGTYRQTADGDMDNALAEERRRFVAWRTQSRQHAPPGTPEKS